MVFWDGTEASLVCHDGSPYPPEFDQRFLELKQLLDRIQEATGQLLIISGYRSPAYNAKLAGKSDSHQVASGSQHVQGRAADIRCVNGTVQDLRDEILALYGNGCLPFLGGIGFYPVSNWCHVDTDRASDGHLRRWNAT
jgi:uncharacterized protein YcbK (DUF882 family)